MISLPHQDIDYPQKLPEQSSRVETGSVQFGDDWPGVFIRGDNALYFAYALEQYINSRQAEEKRLLSHGLHGLVDLLRSCEVRVDVPAKTVDPL